MSKRLTRQDILDADDRQKEVLLIPEWGGEVIVRGLSATDRDDFESSLLTKNGKKRDINTYNVRAKLAVRCLVDDEGTPLFSIEDIQRLGLKSASALSRIFEVSQRLSGIGDQDVEELVKNSETDQSVVSNSASPSR